MLTAEFVEISGDYAGTPNGSGGEIPGSKRCSSPCVGRIRELLYEANANWRNSMARRLRKLRSPRSLSKATPVRGGNLSTAYEMTILPFQPHTRETYLAESQSADPFLARRGRLMLRGIGCEKSGAFHSLPGTSRRFGGGPAWLALGGEVVIDFQLRLKSEFGSDSCVVLGYSNDVMGYIPSRRVQREGGYEAGDALMYFSQPGWFTEEVEDLVLRSARRVLAAVGVTMHVRPSSAQ